MSEHTTSPIALVTGASRGLGRATALRLAADGYHVIVHYAASREAAERVAEEITGNGGSASLVRADLAEPAGIAVLLEQTRGVLGDGRLCVLVNNAGIAQFADFEATEAETIDRQYAVNVRAPYLVTAGLIEHLADDARLVFLSSVVVKRAFPGAIAYNITKGAVETLVINLAALLGPRGIRVNAVAPGATETDMAGFLQEEEGRAMALGMQALKRIGQPEDIGDVIAFLAGSDSRWITGQTIEVAGGWAL